MQERQEYLDRYFVFSEALDYQPPKDWSRTNGLVEDIRRAYLKLEEQTRLDELMRPKAERTHEPQRPLELPQAPKSTSSPSSPTPKPVATPPRPRTPTPTKR